MRKFTKEGSAVLCRVTVDHEINSEFRELFAALCFTPKFGVEQCARG